MTRESLPARILTPSAGPHEGKGARETAYPVPRSQARKPSLTTRARRDRRAACTPAKPCRATDEAAIGGHTRGADPPGSPSSSSSLRPAPLFILADGRRPVNRASSREADRRRRRELGRGGQAGGRRREVGRPRSPRRQSRGGRRDAANPPLPRNLLAETAHQV